MLIDIHVHTAKDIGLKRQDGSRFPTPEELIQMMDDAGIDKAVMMCTVSPEFRYCFVTQESNIEAFYKYPDRLIPFFGLDPRMLKNSTESDFVSTIKHYMKQGCKGVGEYIPNVPMDDPLNMNLFKQIEEIGIPLTFHLASKLEGTYGCYDEIGLPRLEKVLKEFPKLTFLGHSQVFWAEIGKNVTEENRSDYPIGKVDPGRIPELMRKYPNLHGDLSAKSGYTAISRDLEFGIQFMEEFQDRLYFGTDIANTVQELSIVGFFEKLRVEKLISKKAYEKITWKNAVKLLKLEI